MSNGSVLIDKIEPVRYKFILLLLSSTMVLLPLSCSTSEKDWQKGQFLLGWENGKCFLVDLENENKISIDQILGHELIKGTDLRVYSLFKTAYIRQSMSDSLIVVKINSSKKFVVKRPQLLEFMVIGQNQFLCVSANSKSCFLYRFDTEEILCDTINNRGLRLAMNSAYDNITGIQDYIIFTDPEHSKTVAYSTKTKELVSLNHVLQDFPEGGNGLLHIGNTYVIDYRKSGKKLIRIKRQKMDTVLVFDRFTYSVGYSSIFRSDDQIYVTIRELDRVISIGFGPFVLWRFAAAGFGDYYILDVESGVSYPAEVLNKYAREYYNPTLIDRKSLIQLGILNN